MSAMHGAGGASWVHQGMYLPHAPFSSVPFFASMPRTDGPDSRLVADLCITPEARAFLHQYEPKLVGAVYRSTVRNAELWRFLPLTWRQKAGSDGSTEFRLTQDGLVKKEGIGRARVKDPVSFFQALDNFLQVRAILFPGVQEEHNAFKHFLYDTEREHSQWSWEHSYRYVETLRAKHAGRPFSLLPVDQMLVNTIALSSAMAATSTRNMGGRQKTTAKSSPSNGSIPNAVRTEALAKSLCLKFQSGTCPHKTSQHPQKMRDGTQVVLLHKCAAPGCNRSHPWKGNH
jgi:hypothetical protein